MNMYLKEQKLILGQEAVVPSYGLGRITSISENEICGKPSFIGVTPFVAGYEMKFDYDNVRPINPKKVVINNVYQFEDGITTDIKALAAIDEIRWIDASINEHSDWQFGEYYYELLFQISNHKLKRYASYDNKSKLEQERENLIEYWKNYHLNNEV